MLKIGGFISILIGILHFVSLFWADEIFAYTGVAEQMQELATLYSLLPAIVTLITGSIFILFGLYGLSASGMIMELPLLKLGVFTIASIFIIRATVGYVTPALVSAASTSNHLIFSSVSMIVGLLFLIGGVKKWSLTGRINTP